MTSSTEHQPPRRPMWPWLAGAAAVVAAAVVVVGGDEPAPDLAASATEACTEEYVPAKLAAPAGAWFSNTAVEQVRAGYRVTGSVDVEDESGVTARSEFDCRVAGEDGAWRLVDVTLF